MDTTSIAVKAFDSSKRKVLDQGYIKIVEVWGSDERIVEAARMSTGKGFLGWDEGVCPICGGSGTEDGPFDEVVCYACEGKGEIAGDMKLLRRLWTLNHATPFEMAGMQCEVQAPLCVFREWHRHRTQSYNEASARYSPLPALDYLPTVDRLMLGVNAQGNKQAGAADGAAILTRRAAADWLADLADVYWKAEQLYQQGLAIGIPKELARLSMTVGRYSKMRAQAVLRNWLSFLVLRKDMAAQWEIRQYANEVATMLTECFPRTMVLYEEKQELTMQFHKWLRDQKAANDAQRIAGSGG